MKILLLALSLLAGHLSSKDVLLSFDGSLSLKMWRQTLELVATKGVRFTYFVSAPYFVTESQLKLHPYWGTTEVGEPPVKFRKDSGAENIVDRFGWVAKAQAMGCEIGSHLCGHYDGASFTPEQWKKEFAYFQWALGNNNPGPHVEIKGIRAPCLGVNRAYFRAVNDFGYTYDSSAVRTATESEPFDREIDVNQILVVDGRTDRARHSLAFDYNFEYFKTLRPGLDMEKVFYDSLVYDYEHEPRATQVCLHFQMLGDGAYYRATLKFIDYLADKNPRYLTYLQYFNQSRSKR